MNKTWIHIYTITPDGTALNKEGEDTVQEMLENAKAIPPGKCVWDFVGPAISMNPEALVKSIQTLEGIHWIAFPVEEDGTHMSMTACKDNVIQLMTECHAESPELNAWDILQKGLSDKTRRTIV